jgi:hypothetical protein
VKFLLMIHSDEREWAALPEEEQKAVVEEFGEFARRARESGKLVGSGQLQPTDRATTVRVQNGETVVTDGPYEETKQALGGYFLVDCGSIDDAIELARQLPAPRTSGAVEVRPVYEEEGETS